MSLAAETVSFGMTTVTADIAVPHIVPITLRAGERIFDGSAG